MEFTENQNSLLWPNYYTLLAFQRSFELQHLQYLLNIHICIAIKNTILQNIWICIDHFKHIAANIDLTVRGHTVPYPNFPYNGENEYVFSKRGLKGAFSVFQFH